MKSAAVKMSQALSNYHFLNHVADTNSARGVIINIEDNLEKEKEDAGKHIFVSSGTCQSAELGRRQSIHIHSWFHFHFIARCKQKNKKTQRGKSHRLL